MSFLPTLQSVDAQRQIDYLTSTAPPPVVLAYGIGVDSTALLCGEPISSYDAGGCRRHLTAVENH